MTEIEKLKKTIELYEKYVTASFLYSYWEIESRSTEEKWKDILPYHIKRKLEELRKEIKDLK